MNSIGKNSLVIFIAISLVLSNTSYAFADDYQEEEDDDNASVSIPPPAISTPLLEDELADDNFIEAASRLSLYQKIILLELNLIGHANADGSHASRLKRLEEEVVDIPLREQEPSVPQQIASLLQIAPPSNEAVRFLVEDPPENLSSLEYEKRIPFVASIYQQLNWLERSVFGKQFKGTKIKRRILKLELAVLDKSTENRSDLSITERVHNLMVTVKPNEALLAEDFATPQSKQQTAQIYQQESGPGYISKGIRKFNSGASGVRRSINSMLSSPTFWTIVAGGAALFGALMLSRSNNNGQSYAESERMCMGHWNCHRCKNCFYCKHCNQTMQPCGVFFRTRELSQ